MNDEIKALQSFNGRSVNDLNDKELVLFKKAVQYSRKHNLVINQNGRDNIIDISIVTDEIHNILCDPKDDPYIKARIDEINKKHISRCELLENEDYRNLMLKTLADGRYSN